MRPVLHGDVRAAARALLSVPACAREGLARRLVAQAEAADRYRKRMGRAHPFWGNGTLMAAALGRGAVAADRRLDDVEFADCFVAVLEALKGRRRVEG
ncbi:hypothetical protein [Pacificoceanicola onchidii]|uniref:DUF7742 family protein n=1 Tax=Pacificoceanicola onchidii TaxID=2562685 RepID=UPI0010A5AA49|nr:hypothetical protein [Pacificoceanicola onchidii]